MNRPECPDCDSDDDVELETIEGVVWARCLFCGNDFEYEPPERDRLEEE